MGVQATAARLSQKRAARDMIDRYAGTKTDLGRLGQCGAERATIVRDAIRITRGVRSEKRLGFARVSHNAESYKVRSFSRSWPISKQVPQPESRFRRPHNPAPPPVFSLIGAALAAGIASSKSRWEIGLDDICLTAVILGAY